MGKQSAGILLYRKVNKVLQVFLVHPGGPFWKNKDDGAWSVPKGEYEDDEDPLTAAKREFYEETVQYIDGDFTRLSPVKLKSGKTIQAWAVEGDIDHENIKSNLFEMEWPPKSGKKQSFAEVDRGGWFTVDEAKIKLNVAQVGFVEELVESLK
ncbi:Predicted NTP pyrophosphohydrolase, NUDIX family [Mucilaginibacter pineti]|uniref:Predicted NTP pyrophosphohydrolase, NUDIX family n=1 Tax=Mucilaginibacter pineti TaxID=1391627 RepID=A0A1G6YS95_9SPHI|nr:NUDIX domain-containing protein [Mucilaginibacter pineti]SDD92903.1 Predicted NTP pyrophosphohydrolase, NUDIX family [Mucilaginibacter pineti]